MENSFISKTKNFLKKYSQQIKMLLLLIITLIIISSMFLGVLYFTGIIYYEDGFCFNTGLFSAFKNSIWIYFIFLITQVVSTVLLCFFPGASMISISLGVTLFGGTWQCFIVCFLGVLISSILMDLIGRFGGSKLIIKMIGEKEYNQALNIVQEKGMVYLPFMYLLPIFPDDAICMIAGMTKIKFWLHILYIFVCRGIGCATIIFGSKLIPFDSFTTFYDWFVFGAVIIVYVSILLKIAMYIDKKLCGK